LGEFASERLAGGAEKAGVFRKGCAVLAPALADEKRYYADAGEESEEAEDVK